MRTVCLVLTQIYKKLPDVIDSKLSVYCQEKSVAKVPPRWIAKVWSLGRVVKTFYLGKGMFSVFSCKGHVCLSPEKWKFWVNICAKKQMFVVILVRQSVDSANSEVHDHISFWSFVWWVLTKRQSRSWAERTPGRFDDVIGHHGKWQSRWIKKDNSCFQIELWDSRSSSLELKSLNETVLPALDWKMWDIPFDLNSARILLCDLAGSERLKKSDVGSPRCETRACTSVKLWWMGWWVDCFLWGFWWSTERGHWNQQVVALVSLITQRWIHRTDKFVLSLLQPNCWE